MYKKMFTYLVVLTARRLSLFLAQATPRGGRLSDRVFRLSGRALAGLVRDAQPPKVV